VGIHIYVTKYKHFCVRENISVEFYPIIFERYWYFSEYFGMYLFLPVINKGIESLNKNELKLVVMSILGIFVIWRDYKNTKKDILD
jgi:surface polysaccharide O-acyltransferase-like enzyme